METMVVYWGNKAGLNCAGRLQASNPMTGSMLHPPWNRDNCCTRPTAREHFSIRSALNSGSFVPEALQLLVKAKVQYRKGSTS